MLFATTTVPPVCESHFGTHDIECQDRPVEIVKVWDTSRGRWYTVRSGDCTFGLHPTEIHE